MPSRSPSRAWAKLRPPPVADARGKSPWSCGRRAAGLGGPLGPFPALRARDPADPPGQQPRAGAPDGSPGQQPRTGAPGRIPGQQSRTGASGRIPGQEPRAGAPSRSSRQDPGQKPRAGAPDSSAAPGPVLVLQRSRSPPGLTALAAAWKIVPVGYQGCAGPGGKHECRRSCRCCKRMFKTRVWCRVLNRFLLGYRAWSTLGAWRDASGFVPEVVT